MNTDRSFFSSQLRKILFEKNLTQEELGKMIGVKRPMISQWMTGIRNPNLKSIKKIADALDISINYLIDDGKDVKENKTVDNNIVSLVVDLIRENNKVSEEKMKRFELEIELLKKEIKDLKNK